MRLKLIFVFELTHLRHILTISYNEKIYEKVLAIYIDKSMEVNFL